MTSNFKIARVSDQKIADFFSKFAAQFTILNSSVTAYGFATINVNFKSEASGEFKTLLDLDSEIIESIDVSIPGVGIGYRRGGASVQADSSYFDEIIFTQHQHNSRLATADYFPMMDFLRKQLPQVDPQRFLGVADREQATVLAIHEATLMRLEKLNEELIRKGTEFRDELERAQQSKFTALENETRSKQMQLESSFAIKEQNTERTAAELKAKLDAIDDRDNTHVRREIRSQILKDVNARVQAFGVSSSTAAKRLPVLVGILCMIAVFGFLVYNTSAELKDLEVNHATDILTYAKMSKADRELSLTPEPIETAVRVWHWLRLLLSSFGLIGTLLYFIKWQNKWADRHAESEFELQQFQLDVNRASWVIESCLEWRKETSNHVPAELLKSITHNLFSRGNAEVENVVHPADALASALMGSASKVKLKMGDSDVEFDKPGKIAKSVAAKDD